MITFNKPYLAGNETEYIKQAVQNLKISGDGLFTKKCHQFFEAKYKFKKVLLTTSCTDALEMAAILLDIKPGDEVIAPAYTFVSTVNAFVLRGAKIIFVDSCSKNPNLDVDKIEALITPKTKVIVPVHYAGISCDMDKLMQIAEKHNLFVVEDAAQAIDSFYKGKPLGSIGHLSAFSFHETKNIISGEGGMLVVNDERFIKRAEIIREKGTNRSAFFRGEVDKYGWVDIGSSFLPSDIIAAFLFSQLENLEDIQKKRLSIWNKYFQELKSLEDSNKIALPSIPEFASNNAHMFYIVCASLSERTELIEHLKNNEIHAVFHYLSLNKSPYYLSTISSELNKDLINSDNYTDRLLRLPMYYELTAGDIQKIVLSIKDFYKSRK
jgi:dTDP-4-amino-4,6-dideoxygalactose transaminase